MHSHPVMKAWVAFVLACCCFNNNSSKVLVQAIFADEAGVSDFLVATAGHGPISFVEATADSVITSDGPAHGHQLGVATQTTSCFVASRRWNTGKVAWRRNVCTTGTSSNSDKTYHAVAAAAEGVWSMDNTGVVRAWTAQGGNLLWDALVQVPPSGIQQPRVLVAPAASASTPSAVGAVMDEYLTLLDATTGEAMTAAEPLRADQVMKQQGGPSSSRGQARWLQMLSDNSSDQWTILLGWVYYPSSKDAIVTSSGSDLLVVTMEWNKDEEALKITGSSRLNHIKDQFDVSTLRIGASGHGTALSVDGTHAIAFSTTGDNYFSSSSDNDINALLNWSKLTTVAALSDTVARLSGKTQDNTQQQALFQLPSWTPLKDGASPLKAAGLVYAPGCATSSSGGVVLALDNDSNVKVWSVDDGSTSLQTINADATQDDVSQTVLDSPTMAAHCMEDGSLMLLLSTALGTTAAAQVTTTSPASSVWAWSTEEGLGHITSALLLDASHAVVADDLAGDEDSEQEIEQRLQVSARLSSQWASLTSLVSPLSSTSAKDRLFGFVQVAVLVSEQTNRLYGMPLSGEKRGSVLWTVDLSSQAVWHKLVHGTFNAHKATHGIHGGTHARELLVVSGLSNSVEWKCVDGTNGDIHAEGAFDISSPVKQLLPMLGGGSCRQQAMLLFDDLSSAVIPDTEASAHSSSLKHALEDSSNGLFAHVTTGGEAEARLQSYQITSQTSPARLVGQTTFPGERLVHTVYPTRDEAINSPCTVLGDDSLLLKYLNPHLAVIVTVKDEGVEGEEDPFDAVLRRSMLQTDKKKNKKPLGVTPKAGSKVDPATADADPAVVKEDEPNLFINVIDTVSGRVLHRTSHTNAATSPRHIQSVISENWVVYSFVNAKTRKTEVGVLSLYEGMIHKKGLTAFTTPEQTTEFSSWNARDAKPVVLAKTYTIAKPVTALGVTQTRNGISSHQILFATNDDHIYALPRSILEPRRPLSDLKDTEKLEGLRQYSELIPLVSLQALSYNKTVHAPTHIASGPTELESQTLVFAYGGPDLFFARTSPSKGFDMLPESFNRILLSMLVVGLVSVVVVTKRMAGAKMVKQGWL